MKGFFVFMLLISFFSKPLNSAEVIRLAGFIPPSVEIDRLDTLRFGVRSNSKNEFRYEISAKSDYRIIQNNNILTVRKREFGKQKKKLYLTIIAR